MKRYTVFDPSLGRYVVPLSQGQCPLIGICADGTMELLFGDVIDHLAQLEIAAEAVPPQTAAQRMVYCVTASNEQGQTLLISIWRSKDEAEAEARRLNESKKGLTAFHWVGAHDLLGKEVNT